MPDSRHSVTCPKCRFSFAAEQPNPAPLPREPEALTMDDVGQANAPSATQDQPTRIARFLIEAFLGEGAFGRVYRAMDPALRRTVALKVAKAEHARSPERVERFVREARAVANLMHPHIVAVFDAGTEGGCLYIASAFVAGKSLDHVLEALPQGGKLPLDQAVGIVRKLAEALGYAHTQGVIHRDVKPANAMLRDDGEVLLMDFGLAKRSDEERLTQEGQALGTPAYMAPEQWLGRAIPASDQYSLGCLFFELLTGRPPFSGGDLEHYLFRHLKQQAPSPRQHRPELPLDLETICLKCLEKESAARYPSCQALADDLRRWQEGEPVQARRASLAERATKWSRRNPAIAGLMAAVVLVLLTGVAVSGWFASVAVEEARTARQAKSMAETQTQAARKAENDAEDRAKEAKKARADAVQEANEARWNLRGARDAQHAIQIDLALRARQEKDYDRMAELINEMRPEYDRVWETCYVRNLWLRESPVPRRAFVGHTRDVVNVAFSPDGTRVLVVGALLLGRWFQ